jgi:hypothetical protein
MIQVEMSEQDTHKRLGQRILMLWFVLYAFVGTQMTWRLSPFIGKPEDPFFLIRPSRDNFYMDVIRAAQGAINFSPSTAAWMTPVLLAGLCLVTLGGAIFFGGLFFGKTSKRQEEARAVDTTTA